MATFAALLAVVLTWGLVSGRLARYSITLPIVLVVVGLLWPDLGDEFGEAVAGETAVFADDEGADQGPSELVLIG